MNKNPFKITNENPFSHQCSNGTFIKCDRCDFRTPVTVVKPKDIDENNFITDISEMIGFHAINIWPDLNGFQGYGTIHYNIVLED